MRRRAARGMLAPQWSGCSKVAERNSLTPMTNVIRLYLPLLAHPQPAVRQHAGVILLSTYGSRALTYLRRLLDDPDTQTRQEVRLALLAIHELTGEPIQLRPFAGMYIECLGALNVYAGNRELGGAEGFADSSGRAGWHKVQGVLAYLVHCGKLGASREALGTAVWGASWSDSSLARTLTALRQLFAAHADSAALAERALVIDASYCRLDPEHYHTDVQLFERTLAAAVQCEHEQGLPAAAPLYAHATNMYAGAYMAGVTQAARWCRERRDFLLSSFVIAAERQAEHLFQQREFEQCARICAQALDADPRADDVAVWQLRAFAARGQHADLELAFRSYARASRIDTRGALDESDPVVRTYHELSAAHSAASERLSAERGSG